MTDDTRAAVLFAIIRMATELHDIDDLLAALQAIAHIRDRRACGRAA